MSSFKNFISKYVTEINNENLIKYLEDFCQDFCEYVLKESEGDLLTYDVLIEVLISLFSTEKTKNEIIGFYDVAVKKAEGKNINKKDEERYGFTLKYTKYDKVLNEYWLARQVIKSAISIKFNPNLPKFSSFLENGSFDNFMSYVENYLSENSSKDWTKNFALCLSSVLFQLCMLLIDLVKDSDNIETDIRKDTEINNLFLKIST
jgi:hypothetical protein